MSNAKDLGLCNDKIVSVERTNGNGAPGTVDTYTITLRSGDTYNFEVTNGSNYDASPKGVYSTFDYLIMFFENLLQDKKNELKNSELYIKELFENNN